MITMTITAQTPEELYSTIKGCAVLILEDCPTAEPEAKVLAAPAKPQAPTAPPAPTVISAPTAPQAMPAPSTPPVPPVATVPTAPPPTPAFTYEAVAKAGADLVAARPDLMPTLMTLLQKYGVQAVTELKQEQLGPFAAELRQQGAKI